MLSAFSDLRGEDRPTWESLTLGSQGEEVDAAVAGAEPHIILGRTQLDIFSQATNIWHRGQEPDRVWIAYKPKRR